MDLNPYLTFSGTAREAAEFYADALDGTVEFTQTFGEMPDAGPMDESVKSRIAHTRVRFGDKVLMISDTWSPNEVVSHSGFTLQTSWETQKRRGPPLKRSVPGVR